jgi:hypothetical protein
MKNSLKISLLTLLLSVLTTFANTFADHLTTKWTQTPVLEQKNIAPSFELPQSATATPSVEIKPMFDPKSITKENIFQNLVPIVTNCLIFLLSLIASWLPIVKNFSLKGTQTLAIAIVLGIGAMLFGASFIQVGLGYLMTTLFYDKIANPVIKFNA